MMTAVTILKRSTFVLRKSEEKSKVKFWFEEMSRRSTQMI